MRASVDGMGANPHLVSLLFPAFHGAGTVEESTGDEEASQLLSAVGSSLNTEQRTVVHRIMDSSLSADHALLVFGPPGTGKTLTLVEAILAALSKGGKGTRMLCCAPSDSAADVLVQRLLARSATFSPPPPAFTPWDQATAEGGAGAGGGKGRWLLRLNSYVRDIESVRPEVVPYTAALDEASGRFGVPPLQELEEYTLIVTTCATSTLLHERGVARGHFDFILVDEAAQALEPETLLPLSFKGPASRVVLAGDWKQLGPVVRSRCCDSLGLGKSLLQRLATQPWYTKRDCKYLVKLVRNYRSHEELLHLPSALFYENSLIAAADEATTHDLLGAACVIAHTQLPAHSSDAEPQALVAVAGNAGALHEDDVAEASRAAQRRSEEADREDAESDGLGMDAVEFVERVLDQEDASGGEEEEGEEEEEEEEKEEAMSGVDTSTPLLFFGVEGKDIAEDDSPSFYNPTEASAVRTLVQRLLASDFDISTNHIGVIAPYRKQVQKIRLLLRSDNLGAVRVGTVDDYQGQEERIIIISTTLSNSERLGKAEDTDSNSLGFLSNERRFNVAITRATSLCIIVGNPYLMLARGHWKALMQHCISRRAYAGCPPPLAAVSAGAAMVDVPCLIILLYRYLYRRQCIYANQMPAQILKRR